MGCRQLGWLLRRRWQAEYARQRSNGGRLLGVHLLERLRQQNCAGAQENSSPALALIFVPIVVLAGRRRDQVHRRRESVLPQQVKSVAAERPVFFLVFCDFIFVHLVVL